MKSVKAPKDVDSYLKALPKDTRVTLESLRKAIKSAAPKAEEVISYQMPHYRYKGRVAYFAAFKNHCSLFVISDLAIEQCKNELKPFDVHGKTIHFTIENPLPSSLIKKMIRITIKERDERAKK